MAPKSTLGKLQDTVVGTVRGVAQDPVGSAKGAVHLGRAVVGGVVGEVAGQVGRVVRSRTGGGTPAPSAPSAPAPVRRSEAPAPTPKPTDVARVVERNAPAAADATPETGTAPAKKAAAKKAPAKKAPAKKAPAKKAPAKKAPAKKAPAKKAPAKKAAAQASTPSGKLPAKKATPPPAKPAQPADAPKSAAEVLEDADLPSPIESIGTSPAAAGQAATSARRWSGRAPGGPR